MSKQWPADNAGLDRRALARRLSRAVITAALVTGAVGLALAAASLVMLTGFEWREVFIPGLWVVLVAIFAAAAIVVAAGATVRLHPVYRALAGPEHHLPSVRASAARAPLELLAIIVAVGAAGSFVVHLAKFSLAPGVYSPNPLRTFIRFVSDASTMLLIAFPLSHRLAMELRPVLALLPGGTIPNVRAFSLRWRLSVTGFAVAMLYTTAFATLVTSGQLVRAGDLAEVEMLVVFVSSVVVAVALSRITALHVSGELNDLSRRLDALALRTTRGARIASVPIVSTGEIGDLERAYERLSHRIEEDLEEIYATRVEQAGLAGITSERSRVARELHDGLAKELVGLALVLEGMAHQQKGRAVRDDLLRCAAAARELAMEGRALLRAFRSESENTLAERLRSAVDGALADGCPTVTLSVPDDLPPFDGTATREIGRIVDEALTNVRRHARASQATVLVTLRGEHLEVCINDDGRGPPDTVSGGHYGIVGMRERAELLGGTLEVRRAPGGGTTVLARVPLDRLAARGVGLD